MNHVEAVLLSAGSVNEALHSAHQRLQVPIEWAGVDWVNVSATLGARGYREHARGVSGEVCCSFPPFLTNDHNHSNYAALIGKRFALRARRRIRVDAE